MPPRHAWCPSTLASIYSIPFEISHNVKCNILISMHACMLLRTRSISSASQSPRRTSWTCQTWRSASQTREWPQIDCETSVWRRLFTKKPIDNLYFILMNLSRRCHLGQFLTFHLITLSLMHACTPRDRSRLGCQIIASKELEGLRVRIPSASRNFYVSKGRSACMWSAQPPPSTLYLFDHS